MLSKGKRDLCLSIELVNPMTHPNLFLKLNHAMVMSCAPNNLDEVANVIVYARKIFDSMEFLNKHGKNYLNKIQVLARHFATVLIRAGKPMHGIAMMRKTIEVLRQGKE